MAQTIVGGTSPGVVVLGSTRKQVQLPAEGIRVQAVPFMDLRLLSPQNCIESHLYRAVTCLLERDHIATTTKRADSS